MIDGTVTLNQLTQSTNGANVLAVMIGANNFVKSDKENFIAFKFKASKQYNYVQIRLDASDTYTMILKKIWGNGITREKEVAGLYNDMLMSTFEKETGLYLKF